MTNDQTLACASSRNLPNTEKYSENRLIATTFSRLSANMQIHPSFHAFLLAIANPRTGWPLSGWVCPHPTAVEPAISVDAPANCHDSGGMNRRQRLSGASQIVLNTCGTTLPLLAGLLFITGCASPKYNWSSSANEHSIDLTNSGTGVDSVEQARSLPMFRGDTGLPVTWNELLVAANWADVIIIGEQHDDAVGHAVQLAVIQDVLTTRARSAVSMEMLERDEQAVLDDYLEGIIDAATLAKLTFSESWAGEGSWIDWYQPMIDAAKNVGAPVIAANAPRRYVRLARTAGYDRMRALPSDRRRLFDLPRRQPDDLYRQRFFDLMSGDGAHGSAEQSAAAFRSQQVWDATMAASIVHTRKQGAPAVVHVVGQFHSDFNGGLVQQIRARSPGARILVISMQREDATSLREEDRGRADVVLYTGPRPPEPEESAEEPDTAADEEATEEQPEPAPPVHEPEPVPGPSDARTPAVSASA